MTLGPASGEEAGAAERPRVMSGIAATGRLHIGNYVGAISVWVAGQAEYANFFCIADLHALTAPEEVDADKLRERLREIAALYIACGIDPESSVIFRQSEVSAHAELAWLLDCVTPVGWLERMTQYKAKRETATSASAGLFTYPVLQAADILLYQADYVPVGDDQRQHVELTRDVAHRFNHLFAEVFRLPAPLIRESGARIMGLDDPLRKMSKSVAERSAWHAIGLLDPPEMVRRSIMRAVTDSGSGVDASAPSAGVANLLVLYEVLKGEEREAVRARFDGRGYGELKRELAEVAVGVLEPIQARYAELREERGYLDRVLSDGRERAATVAGETLLAAMRAVGLR